MNKAAQVPPAPRAPLFSFLTTAYRSEDTVGRTIRSVLDQTFTDWELVVVDNGNVDTMRDAVAPFLVDPRIRLVRQENRGVAGGTLAAADHATGRYLVVLNSDDLVRPEFAERMAAVIAEHPGVAAVTCDAALFLDPGQRQLHPSYLGRAGLHGTPDPTRPLRVSEVIDGPNPYYTAPIRRDVWDAVGGMSSLGGLASRIDDLDFWLRTLTAGHDVRMIPDNLALFRVEAGSVSRPVSPEACEELEAQVEGSLRRAAARTGDEEDQLALARALRRLGYWQEVRRARVALQAGDPARAVDHYSVALGHRRTVGLLVRRQLLRWAPAAVLLAYRAKRRSTPAMARMVGPRGMQSWRMRFGHDA